jgi:mannose-6-phosphate isomerase
MAIEHAQAHAISKPWGVLDLRPWSDLHQDGNAIGEIQYERSGGAGAKASLLLKLLFTSQSLSIQVHPDDAYALSVGLPNGKSEAWYVLSAKPDAKIALGLKQRLTPQQLRGAIDDGSISKLVVWQPASQGEVIFVPAGTIHAIGAGLVIAEIQQRSDATFRMFDFGRGRELHIDSAVAVSDTGSAAFSVLPERISDERALLLSNPHFVLERINLEPNSTWSLTAERETWVLVLNGSGRAGSFDVGKGEAIFAEGDRVAIYAGADGMVCLTAYAGGVPISHLLEEVHEPSALDLRRLDKVRVQTPLPQAKAGPTNRRPETIQ